MIKKLLFLFLFGVGAGIIALSLDTASAQVKENSDAATAEIQFPVAELGNCKDQANCKKYCDNPKNIQPCVDFAEKHGLMPAEEIARARKFIAAGGRGPGGCTSKDSCEAYCNDIGNIDKCLEYAEREGIMPPKELEEARKVQTALRQGAQLPGNCRSKNECEAYCQPDNAELMAGRMEECITFAKAAGFMPPEELAEAEKALEAVKRGAKPPPCRGREACDEYCQRPENMEGCLDFAEAAGFIPPEEAVRARKMVKLGITTGPGGCRGDECKDFCENPENQETCSNFMVEILEKNPDLKLEEFIPEEDFERMNEGLGQMQDALADAPDEVRTCLNEAFPGITDKIESGNFSPIEMMKIGPKMGPVMQGCFMKSFGGGEEGFGPPGGFEGGPDAPGKFPGGPGGFPGGPSGGAGGGMPAGVGDCFRELGLQFPPKKPPSADEQQRIGECMRARSGGPEDRPGDEQGSDRREFRPSEGFPGKESEFPNGEFSPEDFDGQQFPGGAPTQEQIKQIQEQQFNQQFQDTYQQQFQQQYQQQFNQQIQQLQDQGQIPAGFDPSQIPQGQIPSGFDPNQGGGFGPPPGGSFPPPPGSYYYAPAPQAQINPPSLLGFFAQILGLY